MAIRRHGMVCDWLWLAGLWDGLSDRNGQVRAAGRWWGRLLHSWCRLLMEERGRERERERERYEEEAYKIRLQMVYLSVPQNIEKSLFKIDFIVPQGTAQLAEGNLQHCKFRELLLVIHFLNIKLHKFTNLEILRVSMNFSWLQLTINLHEPFVGVDCEPSCLEILGQSCCSVPGCSEWGHTAEDKKKKKNVSIENSSKENFCSRIVLHKWQETSSFNSILTDQSASSFKHSREIFHRLQCWISGRKSCTKSVFQNKEQLHSETISSDLVDFFHENWWRSKVKFEGKTIKKIAKNDTCHRFVVYSEPLCNFARSRARFKMCMINQNQFIEKQSQYT